MKYLLCLFLFLFSGLPFAAVAADGDDLSSRGSLDFSEKKLPPATTRQFEEALAISDSCKAYTYTNKHYDCDCVGMKFLDMRREKGDDASAYWLREDAQKACPNKPAMAGEMYQRCLLWNIGQRGNDADSFCSCYGSEFAKVYGRNPSENQLVIEAQMVTALKKCDVGSINRRKQDAQALVKQLKEKGMYDQLFPAAPDEN